MTAPRTGRARPKKSALPAIDDVRRRAYEIYLGRNGEGDELSDWLEAERDLLTQHG